MNWLVVVIIILLVSRQSSAASSSSAQPAALSASPTGASLGQYISSLLARAGSAQSRAQSAGGGSKLGAGSGGGSGAGGPAPAGAGRGGSTTLDGGETVTTLDPNSGADPVGAVLAAENSTPDPAPPLDLLSSPGSTDALAGLFPGGSDPASPQLDPSTVDASAIDTSGFDFSSLGATDSFSGGDLGGGGDF